MVIGFFFLNNEVRVGCYCQEMGRSVSFLSKNRWEWVAFFEKWVGVGCFIVKRVGTSRFCQKMGGSGLFFLKKGSEWVRVTRSECIPAILYSHFYTKVLRK